MMQTVSKPASIICRNMNPQSASVICGLLQLSRAALAKFGRLSDDFAKHRMTEHQDEGETAVTTIDMADGQISWP
jgi:hypothetical protein